MGRQVQIRESYKRDALFLIKLGQAVEKDLRRDAVWRKRACGIIQELSLMFMQVDDSEEKEKPKKRSRRRAA